MDGVVRQAIRAAGEVLLTVGLIGLLFVGYLVWGTGLRAASAQRALSSELSQQWRLAPMQVAAVAQPKVTRGRVQSTKCPGQLCSFASAGHRVTAGNPFW